MKKLPIGIQNIREILEEGYVYVDKTSFAHQLIKTGKHYFMSRPRRFGKSLFLDTLKEIFKGNKELFKHCIIYQSDYDWQAYPVIHLDFYKTDHRSALAFEESLKRSLKEIAETHHLTITTPTVQEGLAHLVKQLYNKHQQPVVILIDEYDNPIIENLENPTTAQEIRDLLKKFYGMLKSTDEYLKFTFTAGITKFSKVSLFSGPNNLDDISMDDTYATMMGYTEAELEEVFAAHVQAIAHEQDSTAKEVFSAIKYWYNGYRFSEAASYVYNPFSTLKFIRTKRVESHWYASGTPSFLIEQIEKYPKDLVPLNGTTVTKSKLSDVSSVEHIDLTALMYQTGYLTIKGYRNNRYQLGFPNEEVRMAFIESLVNHFSTINREIADRCYDILENQQPALFFEQVKTIMASFPYNLFSRAQEQTYHGMLLGIISGMGIEVVAEKATNLGRIDIVLELPNTFYVMELKLDSSAEVALAQVHEKRYYEAFLRQGKEVALIGINFSSEERNVADWQGELRNEAGQLIRSLGDEKVDG